MSELSERISNLSPEQRALLARRLSERQAESATAMAPTTAPMAAAVTPIAIVSVGCRLPGADSPEALWSLLAAGGDAVRPIPADRWDRDALYDADFMTPGTMSTRHGGFLDDVRQFDAEFFGISPREAASMDPQQRLLLEVAIEALNDAGLLTDRLAGTATGVYLGIHSHSMDYYERQLRQRERIDTHTLTGSAHSIAANRLSYVLDLRGPSFCVDTGCSSSLVAVHLACQSLRLGECDLALAGGVNLVLEPDFTVALTKLQLISADGHCKTFDASAGGFVPGEGCGLVVLKRLADAERDGDPIIAIIRGSAVNQDGATNGLTAPSGPAQVALLRQALHAAAVDPEQIGLVETSASGTTLGDPIEVESLAQVLGAPRPAGQACYLGAIKTNIGNLEAAAGIAGLIKAVLCLRHRQIPANLHFRTLNPHIQLEGTSLAVPTENVEWHSTGFARYAGVSSFGFGGTNAHVVIEEGPADCAIGDTTEDNSPLLLPLSARNEAALVELARAWRDFLSSPATGGSVSRRNLAYTASVRRLHYDHRFAVVGRTRQEWIAGLAAFVDAADPHIPQRDLERAEPAALTFVYGEPIAAWAGSGSSQAVENATPQVAALDPTADVSLSMLRAVGESYASGHCVEWTKLYPQPARCVALPRYPWQRRTHWLERPDRESSAPGEDTADWFYDLEWQPLPATDARQRQLGVGGTVLIFADIRGVGAALADRLTGQGQPCVLVVAGTSYQRPQLNHYEIDPRKSEDYHRLLHDVAGGSNTPCQAVVHLWSLDALLPPSQSWTELHTRTCGSAMLLVQAMAAGEKTAPARLWLVTAGAQPVTGAVAVSERGVAQASTWGLGRAIVLEYPEMLGGIVDLDPRADAAASAAALAAEMAAGGDDDQIAVRDGRRFAPRIVPRPERALRELRLSPTGSCLVTGGLGGLGIKIARWLVERGVRHLVLVTRSPLPERSTWATLAPDTEAQRRVTVIQDLEALGATVTVASIDVADRAALANLVAEFGVSRPPLRGVIHAAATFTEQSVREMDLAGLEANLRPKVVGAWNLHELTRDIPLDMFVLFSSVFAVLGTRGQPDYAAGNQMLDALAHHRHSLGLPALSINWGAWDEIRLISSAQRELVTTIGLLPMRPPLPLTATGHLVATGAVQRIVARVDWDVLKGVFEARRVRPLLSHMGSTAVRNRQQPATLPAGWRTLPPRAQRQTIRDCICRHVATVLGFADSGGVDQQRGFFQIGMTSLTSVELRRRLEAEFGRDLPATLVFNYSSVTALTNHLAQLLQVASDDAEFRPAQAAESLPELEPAQPAADRTEDELFALLAARLGGPD